MSIKFAVIAILSVRLSGAEQQHSVLSNRPLCLLPKLFHPPKQKLCNSSKNTSFSFPSPWERTKLCCFLSQWTAHILGVLCKWAHIMLVFSCLTSFNIWFPRFILVVACVRTAFLFMVENSPCIFHSSVRVSGPVVTPAFWLLYIMPQWKLTCTFIGVSLQLFWVYRPPTPFFFLKFALHPLTSTKDLPIVSAFTVMKEAGRRVLLFWEKVKSKVLSVCLAAAAQVVGTPSVRGACPTGSPPPELHSASRHQTAEALNCVWIPGLDLCLFCASESNTCPKSIDCSSCSISAYERFPRSTLLQDSKRSLCI